jgi:hypothetical protein
VRSEAAVVPDVGAIVCQLRGRGPGSSHAPGASAGGGATDAAPVGRGASLGITASIAHRGEWTPIVLSNLDRGIMGRVEGQLQEWLDSVRG